MLIRKQVSRAKPGDGNGVVSGISAVVKPCCVPLVLERSWFPCFLGAFAAFCRFSGGQFPSARCTEPGLACLP